MAKDKKEVEQMVQRGLDLPVERFMYFNGFAVSLTPHDVLIILQNNNQPIAVLNTSHVIGKTLIVKLQKLLEDFQKISDSHIYTLDELQEQIERSKNANSQPDQAKDQ